MTGQFIRALSGFAACILTMPAPAAETSASMPSGRPARPNIVLIMADDMGYECVGANGGTSYKTPELDSLARSGIRFENCHSQPLCTPSRVQIMTGIYNVRNYVRFGLMHERETTFASLLNKAGYATCIAGKWQLEGGYDAPRRFGFDEYCLWQLNRRPERYRNPGLEINGKQVDFSKGEYGPDLVSDYLCDFIARHKDRPFLAYYPMMLPHNPHAPTPQSPDYGRNEGSTRNDAYFADMVAYADKLVGKVVRKLDELGLRENTLVLFTGDNGTMRGITSRMGNRKVVGGKGTTTSAGTHVPFIASWPGVIPRGTVSADLVDFTDFLPTICEAAGAAVPPELKIDGRSFLPQLQGRKGTPREWIYCWYARQGGPTGKESARNRRYKLYRTGEFYDLDRDIEERSPLDAAGLDDERTQVRAMLQRALDRYAKARPARE